MFHNTSKPSSSTDEGTVVQVDPIRKFCKVRTVSGQNLDNVQWEEPSGGSSRSGDRTGPTMGDRVKLEYGLGYPVITGFLPKLQSSDGSFPLRINSGQQLVDTGNYSPDGTGSYGDMNKPQDMLNGDRVLASIGGAMIAILRAGSTLIRSSRGAEILLSKLDDLVRVVSRNWEHYSDVGSNIMRNFRGRIFRYDGYTNNFSASKNEDYKLHFYYGDTAAAEKVKSDYLADPGAVPSANSTIYKEQVTSSGTEVMHRTLDESGNEELLITNGTFTRRKASNAEVTISYGDQNTITINNPIIKLQRADGAVITMDSSGIRLDFQGGHVNMSGSSVQTTFGGATHTVNASGVRSDFGGHFLSVSSSGVQIG